MKKRRLRILKFAATAAALLLLAWGASAIAVYAAVLDVVLRRSPRFLGPRETLPPPLKDQSVDESSDNAQPTNEDESVWVDI
jgi:vancomycin permeability regulator SanA